MRGMIEVNEPVDSNELAYAIERVCSVARENDVPDSEIVRVLEQTQFAVENDRL